jgi:hypothetical protein
MKHNNVVAQSCAKPLTKKSLARSCGMAPASLTLPSKPSAVIIC